MQAIDYKIRKVCGIAVLLVVPALASFMTGQPMLFPSLGPSAFNLVLDQERKSTARVVIGGHFTGVICGLVSYHILAEGLSLVHHYPAYSAQMLRLALGGMISVILTTWAMLAGKCDHSPACATTLIVSLGLFSTLFDAVLIMASVTVMVLVHSFFAPLYLGAKSADRRSP